MQASRSESRPSCIHDANSPTIVAVSEVMRALLEDLRKLSSLPHPVLLRGETGTGKELAARTLHNYGSRRDGAFVAVNCGAIPAGLAESVLFGHVRGAFTGAHRDHQGAFVRAHRGTLFLDEIGELPFELQSKLLRVLETKRCSAVGGEKEISVDVRVVSATHRDLEAMVAEGQLREDLYHRLGVLSLTIPALRERREDIVPLVRHLAAVVQSEMGRPLVLHRGALEAAQSHDWPGNVRGLRNAIVRAAALHDGVLGSDLVPDTPKRPPESATDIIAVPRGDYRSMNRALLKHVVAEEGSIRKAARVLNVPRSTLGSWLKR